jgi:hypothetical protein
VEARLYGVSFSYPSLAARLMLQHKGIEHEWVKLTPRPAMAGANTATMMHGCALRQLQPPNGHGLV